MEIYRQGDVVLRPVAGIPADAERCGDRIEVASETGNRHVIQGAAYRQQEAQLIMLDMDTPLEHPEHETIVIPKGAYEVATVRSYVPVQNMD